MRIKAIMTPVNELKLLKVDDTAKKAIELIESEGFLSLPVVEKRKFVGFLSKQFIYETFFKEAHHNIDEFLERPVKDFIHNKVDVVKENIFIEQAAEIFFNNKVRFIPVVDQQDNFAGIVTQKALFGVLTKVYGLKDPKISILTDDFKGTLAKIAEIISKNDGNISNIALVDTEVMGIQELSVRVVGTDIDRLVKRLEDKGFKVREVVK